MERHPPKKIVLQLGGENGSDFFPVILVLFTGFPSSPIFVSY